MCGIRDTRTHYGEHHLENSYRCLGNTIIRRRAEQNGECNVFHFFLSSYLPSLRHIDRKCSCRSNSLEFCKCFKAI